MRILSRTVAAGRWAGLALAALVLVSVLAIGARVDGRLSKRSPSTEIVDRRGHFLAEVPGEGGALGYWPLPDALPDKVVQATLEAEDRHFFDHRGVYLPSIGRALAQDLRSRRRVSGASTVAMQVARLQHPASRSWFNKIREALEALVLVHRHGHLAVLRQYLELAPYGNRVAGVERAARMYFDKPSADLDWREASLLAALPQMPGRMSPFDAAGLARARHRADRILRGLHSRGLMSDQDLEEALHGAIALSPRPRRPEAAMHAALEWSAEPRSGRRIERATLDLDLQQAAEAALKDELGALASSGADEGAVLEVDPETGDVLASVGSAGYFAESGSGAIDFTRVKRSPGSALKPVIYGLALDRGLVTAGTELPDLPLELQDGEGAAYVPENSGHQYLGPLLVRTALANSRNIPALELLGNVGVDTTLTALESAGVRGITHEPGRYGLGLALGDLPVTLEELVRVYATFARGGAIWPLRRSMDAPAPKAPSGRLVSDTTAAMLLNILSDPAARRPTFPEGGPLDYPYAVAVKTGTSQGSRDAWAVAVSDRLIVGVWIGRADASPMDRWVTGASSAGELVHRILEGALPRIDPQRAVASAFLPPASYVSRELCTISGRLAGPHCPHVRVEWFAPGTEPVESCPYHHLVEVDVRNGLRATPTCPRSSVVAQSMLDLPEEYADWGRQQRLPLAPLQPSPLCSAEETSPRVTIRLPRDRSRYLWDPDTPAAASTISLQAAVSSGSDEVVWQIDGVPVAQVGYPFEARWSLTPGRHVIVASLAHQAIRSRPITVFVSD